ncbi:glycosyltransferase [Neobacillus sp. DY30]|uniref:glycosyltransferase family 2 protein n=1 Tax=Neobacillus sp. DY30 TaxID=3047871 RepID=UPI0024C0654A|nr:glycosyltransferase [Neobacillus sp. DY30]WHX98457.1 glycosyltransferase [Neobacillus sp. DY30]
MSIEVSIIMISYNKYPQNLYSLYALENQTFDHEKMEVILIDDASSDETPSIQSETFNFPFRYIQCEKNVGRAKTKNIGIEESKGDILIFIDSEVILDPEFVEQHYLYHQTNDNLVVAGCLKHYCAYTVFYPDFFEHEKGRLLHLIKRRRRWVPREKRISFKKRIKSGTDKFSFFSKEEIQQARYKVYAYHEPTFPEVIEKYGPELNDYTIPWKLVITRNVSMRKSLIEAIGPFDEEFQGHGIEDWELGYRLYKYGAKIIDNPNACVYHQEHPRSPDNSIDNINNFLIFLNKHPNFDVGVMALAWLGKKGYIQINEIITEFYQVSNEHPDMLTYMTKGFNALFNSVFRLMSENRKVTKLLNDSGIENDLVWKESIFNERDRLISQNKGRKLIETLDILLNL